MSWQPYVVLDVFTDTPLRGNPVAVFTQAGELTREQMQATARELNLSESVFVLPADTPDTDACVRIFTPLTELPFAGHPVLGAAFALGQESGATSVRLQTAAGVVPVALEREDERIAFGEMDQPLPVLEAFDQVPQLLEVLDIDATELPVEAYRNGPVHVFVALGQTAAVANLRPNPTALAALGRIGVSCFAQTESGRVKTRMFAPGLGVAEDPATGSAAGALALHLARHGQLAPGLQVEIHQGEEIGRPSTLYARVQGTPANPNRVLVGGSAILVAHGEYRLA